MAGKTAALTSCVGLSSLRRYMPWHPWVQARGSTASHGSAGAGAVVASFAMRMALPHDIRHDIELAGACPLAHGGASACMPMHGQLQGDPLGTCTCREAARIATCKHGPPCMAASSAHCLHGRNTDTNFQTLPLHLAPWCISLYHICPWMS